MSDLWLETFCENAMDGCPEIPDVSCDMSVFSPPYKTCDGYTPELMLSLGKTLGRVMRPASLAFMNFGQLQEEFARPFKARACILKGSRQHTNKDNWLHQGQTFIWVKSIAVPCWKELILKAIKPPWGEGGVWSVITNIKKILKGPGQIVQRGHYQPINSKRICHYGHEYVFVFWKAPHPHLDRLSLGVPFTDKSNIGRGNRGKHGDLHCQGDVWYIPYRTRGTTSKKTHEYEYPEELVERCIKLSGISPGSAIFDPFLGGGQTAVCAKKMGMNAYGVEIVPERLETAEERWGATCA
jgi:hypothetical protein